MSLIQTADLIGPALDWAVAEAEGYEFIYDKGLIFICEDREDWRTVRFELRQFSPSTSWALGGPLIDRERLWIGPLGATSWTARLLEDAALQWVGPTALVAAMRCFVAQKAGSEVLVPASLTPP